MGIFKNNNWILGGIGNIFRGSSKNIVAINCNSKDFNAWDNDKTFIEDGRVLGNKWVELNGTTATALSPYALNGDNGNKYKVKADTGDRYGVLDVRALNGESVYLKITDATHNLILSTASNTETIDGNALPYTITATLYDCYQISSDGSNFWIL